MIDYYQILGVHSQASAQEIRQAYRKLAIRYHPDKNPGSSWAEERFKQIEEAHRVLSKAESRRQYDYLRLFSQQQQLNASAERQAYPDPRRRAAAYRRPVAKPFPNARQAVTSRENLIATAWAFGIVFFIIALTFGVQRYQTYQKQQEASRQEQLAASMFNQAEEYMAAGNFNMAYELLRSIESETHFRQKAWQLRSHMMQKLSNKATGLYQMQAYQEAIPLYELYLRLNGQYEPQKYAELAFCYEQTEQWKKAVGIYEAVIAKEAQSMEAYHLAAQIYAFRLQQPQKAEQLYAKAANFLQEMYTNDYGEAFVIAIRPELIPESHAQLHVGYGRLLISMQRFKEAENAFKWALRLRPDMAEAQAGLAESYYFTDQPAEACRYWRMAAEQGLSAAEEARTLYCRK